MAGTHAFGTTLSWNGQVVAGITAVNGIELTVDEVDTTTHSSANRTREFVAGLITYGDVALEGQFEYSDTNGQLAMVTDAAAATSRSFVITFPSSTGTTWTGTGFIKALKVGDAPIDGKIPFTATIKPTGKPTFATAASNNLTNLALTTATLYPSFAAGTYAYSATSTGASVTVTPTFSAGTCTVASGTFSQTVATGVASGAISLGSIGALTVVTVTVQETGKSPKIYTISVAKTA